MTDKVTFDNFMPFTRPSISQAAIDEVVACLHSGWLTTGPRTQQFEQQLQHYLKAPYALALSSGTAALHLGLLALDLNPGDEVITTPMSFAATINTIMLARGRPVLVDVEMDTYNINVNAIEAAITSKTRAIVPVHFAGLPVDLAPLYDLAKHYKLRVIEDAAHAIGATYHGKAIGSFGDTQIFSFHPNKNITTGEGGCLSTRDANLAKKVMITRFHGIDRQAWDRFGKKGNQHYHIVCLGFKYNMMDIQAALGLHQLPALDDFIKQRTKAVKRYYHLLSDWPAFTLPKKPHYAHRHAWHLFAPLINSNYTTVDRDHFMQAMKSYNIGTGLHYQALHLHPYYRQTLGYKPGDFPNAEAIGNSIVSLPLFPGIKADDQERIVAAMRKIID